MKVESRHLRQAFLLVAVSFLALFVSGCASTWVQKDPELLNKKNVRVLMGHYSVKSDAGADLFDLAKQVGGNTSFGDVSQETYTLLKTSLGHMGFDVVTDKRRAQKLNHLKSMTTGDKKLDALIGSLASEWKHPQGANRPFHRIMAGTKLRKEVVNKLKGKRRNEAFLSADLRIEDQDQYLLFKRYRVIIGIQILNQKGEAIFQAKAEGFTGLSFLRNSIGEKRIQKAVADALAKMESVPVEEKISTLTTL